MNWRRWLQPGLIASVLITAVALVISGGVVSEAIGERVAADLAAAGIDWVQVDARWRSVTLTGVAPSEVAQVRAFEIAGGIAGVRGVRDASQLLPLQTPYVWVASRDGSRVTIDGAAPSEGVRDSQLATARRIFPEGEIAGAMELARGASDVYGAATTFALELLALFNDGRVAFSDRVLTVAGTAADRPAHREILRRLDAAVPVGVELGAVEVLPARAVRFVWSASVADSSVSVAGFVPNETMRELVADEVRAAFPGYAVVDESVIASGEPEGFLDAVAFSLKALGSLESGGVTLDGLTLDVAGEAASVEDFERLQADIEADLPAGMTLVAADVLPPVVDTYGFTARLTDGEVGLEGYVATLDDRAVAEGFATGLFQERNVRNDLRVGRGGPSVDWMGAVKFALTELARLRDGTAIVDEDAEFDLQGVARTSADYEAIARADATLPAGLRGRSFDVAPPSAPDYRLEGVRDGGTVVLTGYVDSVERHGEIERRAMRFFGREMIDNRLEFAGGAPDGFFTGVFPALAALSRMSGGRFAVEESGVTVTGFADHSGTIEALSTDLREEIRDGVDLAVEVETRQPGQPITPQDCSARLGAAVSTRPLEFEDGGESILPESVGIMDTVAAVLARCPRAFVEIGVHTDSDGAQADNRDRTQRRADTLREVLVDSGIDRVRIAAVGYGEDEPIADNDTEAGKARNRRIAFALSVAEPAEPFVVPDPAPAAPGRAANGDRASVAADGDTGPAGADSDADPPAQSGEGKDGAGEGGS